MEEHNEKINLLDICLESIRNPLYQAGRANGTLCWLSLCRWEASHMPSIWWFIVEVLVFELILLRIGFLVWGVLLHSVLLAEGLVTLAYFSTASSSNQNGVCGVSWEVPCSENALSGAPRAPGSWVDPVLEITSLEPTGEIL